MDADELFYHEMEEYLDEYKAYLSATLKPSTISKHCYILSMFIEYAIHDCEATSMEAIPYKACGSQFVRWFNNHTDDGLQLSTSRNTIRKFFEFIAEKHGIIHTDLLKKLQKK